MKGKNGISRIFSFGKINRLYIALLFISFFSCGNREKIQFSVVDANGDSCSIVNFAEGLDMAGYIDSISLVALDDSKESALLKDINKCIIKGGRIYLLDFFGTESVKVFDLSGTYLFTVGTKGGGPGEFFRTFDFDVNDDGIYLLDVRNKKIIEYGLDNSFREEYHYGDRYTSVNSFVATNKHNFLLGLDRKFEMKSKVLLVDRQFDVIQEMVPFQETDTEGQLKIGSFRRCGNKIVYYYPISDDVYQFEQSGRLVKKYMLSLNKVPIPADLRKDYKKMVSERIFGGYNYFHETPLCNGRMFVSTIFYGANKALFCLDIKEEKYEIESYEGLLDSSGSLSAQHFNFPVYMDDDMVVCTLNQQIYERLHDKHLIGPFYVKKLAEGSTVLLVYHLRT